MLPGKQGGIVAYAEGKRQGGVLNKYRVPGIGFLGIVLGYFHLTSDSSTAADQGKRQDSTGSQKEMSTSSKVEWGDMVIVSGVLVGAATFLFRKTLFGARKPEMTIAQKAALAGGAGGSSGADEYNEERDFVLKMRNAGKNVVIFYGSQTGTAEDFATRLAKELQSVAVRPLVLDPELYDFHGMAALNEDELAVLILATTGEGEPTDNMEQWYDAFVSNRESPEESEVPEFREPEDKAGMLDMEQPLADVRFAVFGLGNNTYEQFNSHARIMDSRLQALGAQRIGERGEGDDDVDIEEDFAQWKDKTLPLIRAMFGSATPDEDAGGAPALTWTVTETGGSDAWTAGQLYASAETFDARHPFQAPVKATAELTPGADRHVLHVEVDLAGSGMRYEAGDHIGVYAQNSDEEVDLLLAALGLLDRADQAISVAAADPHAAQQALFPHVTTYRAALRHYLEIALPVPRAQIKSLVLPFATSAAARDFLGPLANDKDAHAQKVGAGCLSLARLLNAVHAAERTAGETDLLMLPPAAVFELCPRMQPRFYSISSSARVAPEMPSITAVVLQYEAAAGSADAKLGLTRSGVATNFLLGAKRYLQGDRAVSLPDGVLVSENAALPTHDASGAPVVADNKGHVLGSYTIHPPVDRQLALPVYIRKSQFRLPTDPAVPIIMIGPGTGLAPMRGFVQERAHQARANPESAQGTALLFFGARTAVHDYMYEDELARLFDDIRTVAPQSQVITAFSRDQANKIYVQHRLAEHADAVFEALLAGQDKLTGPPRAHIYVCGDAKAMAKDVTRALAALIADKAGVPVDTAAQWLAEMRKASRYQEDVWS
ncbi:hypothetical protein DL89DRAFT_325650 [Linderina pennispora]|uniref:NADPH--hemoprotein reductase n=1 Tax=Linderina pennispora TaxID=61395 RepID=A0A1Y1VW22_9FUNG|nr:uncharacterized protein DL89DRAFT_325650 [Linderina pennispora]ORX65489.1 hypothetical protein DL89DRAFT_325650 [Linderina pennispora]